MMSTNNILHPANGQPIIVPSQDIVLGLYYVSIMREGLPGEGKIFGDMAELEHALHSKVIHLHTKIKYRWEGVDETASSASAGSRPPPAASCSEMCCRSRRRFPTTSSTS